MVGTNVLRYNMILDFYFAPPHPPVGGQSIEIIVSVFLFFVCPVAYVKTHVHIVTRFLYGRFTCHLLAVAVAQPTANNNDSIRFDTIRYIYVPSKANERASLV